MKPTHKIKQLVIGLDTEPGHCTGPTGQSGHPQTSIYLKTHTYVHIIPIHQLRRHSVFFCLAAF